MIPYDLLKNLVGDAYVLYLIIVQPKRNRQELFFV